MRPRKRPKKTRAGAAEPLGSLVTEKPPVGMVCLGVIIGAHGVRGAVKIKSFAMNASDIAAYGPLQSKDGATRFDLTVHGTSRGAVLAEVGGVDRREAAEELRGTHLYVARDSLPETDDNEFYYADLIGLRVLTADGITYGSVSGIYDYGAGDVIEIERENDGSIMFPFTTENVPKIDLQAGLLIIDPPAETAAREQNKVD